MLFLYQEARLLETTTRQVRAPTQAQFHDGWNCRAILRLIEVVRNRPGLRRLYFFDLNRCIRFPLFLSLWKPLFVFPLDILNLLFYFRSLNSFLQRRLYGRVHTLILRVGVLLNFRIWVNVGEVELLGAVKGPIISMVAPVGTSGYELLIFSFLHLQIINAKMADVIAAAFT